MDGYINLGSYYISQDNVKAMASVMEASTSNAAALAEFLVSCAGPYASALMLATCLSANAQAQTEVEFAAAHNMRVEVTLYDLPVHTSYSEIVVFKAVN